MHVDRNRQVDADLKSGLETSRLTGTGNEGPRSKGVNPGADAKTTVSRCSYCGGAYDRQQSNCPPFCSTRCQQLDLRGWLNESYGLPCENESSPEDVSGLEEMLDDDELS